MTAIPETIVIDRRGLPVKTFFGEFNRPAVDRIVATIPARD